MATKRTFIDMTGQRCGRWLVLAKHGNKRGGAALWACVCNCGNFGITTGHALRKGKSASCGCLFNDRKIENNTTHGGSRSALYRVWAAMHTRCKNTKDSAYKNYGGRGISVCGDWRTFAPFQQWAKNSGYCRGLTLERKENDGNYEPSNCTWATRKAQAANRRNVAVNADGIPWFKIAEKNGVPSSIYHNRRYGGWSDEAAATSEYTPRRIKR